MLFKLKKSTHTTGTFADHRESAQKRESDRLVKSGRNFFERALEMLCEHKKFLLIAK
jgi:hypothetical protein